MLLKSLEEVGQSPNAMMAAEMAVIRLTHVADMPSPGELVARLQDAAPPPTSTPPKGGTPAPTSGGETSAVTKSVASGTEQNGNTALALAPETEALARYARFEDVVELIRRHRDVKLLVEVETTLHLARYQPGRIEFQPGSRAPTDLAQRLKARLQAWTGNSWAVTLVNEGGGKTIAETRNAEKQAMADHAAKHPLLQVLAKACPGAEITTIRPAGQAEAQAAATALPEVDDEWDPFDDD